MVWLNIEKGRETKPKPRSTNTCFYLPDIEIKKILTTSIVTQKPTIEKRQYTKPLKTRQWKTKFLFLQIIHRKAIDAVKQ